MNMMLGVKIEGLSKEKAIVKTREFLSNGKQNKIFTPNPEMLVDAQYDKYFKDVLNSGDLNLCDGFGIHLLSFFKIPRFAGVDFLKELCIIAEKESKPVYFLGSGSKDVIKKTAEEIKNIFPKLKIAGWHPGPSIDFLKVEDVNKIICEPEQNESAIDDIIMTAPDILFVGFGHNKQEKWIFENLKNLPSVKIAVGVGGAFDYISGRVNRAPCFFRKIGIEWLYRLFTQPKRIKRIIKAIFIFPAFYLFSVFKR
jgi:N-acetylglucosaminyldiphosphoundecaprenol N-acetyl-beta-D-mannosaminyltransferase